MGTFFWSNVANNLPLHTQNTKWELKFFWYNGNKQVDNITKHLNLPLRIQNKEWELKFFWDNVNNGWRERLAQALLRTALRAKWHHLLTKLLFKLLLNENKRLFIVFPNLQFNYIIFSKTDKIVLFYLLVDMMDGKNSFLIHIILNVSFFLTVSFKVCLSKNWIKILD